MTFAVDWPFNIKELINLRADSVALCWMSDWAGRHGF